MTLVKIEKWICVHRLPASSVDEIHQGGTRTGINRAVEQTQT